MASSAQRLLAAGRRRATAVVMLRGAGWGLSAGVVAGILLLLAQRLLGPTWPWWAPLTLPPAGLVVGALAGLARRPERLAVAVTLDRALALSDRLGTVLALDAGIRADPAVGELVRAESERRLAGVRAHSAIALRRGGGWFAAAIAGAAMVAAWFGVEATAPQSPAPEPEEIASMRAELGGTMDEALREARETAVLPPIQASSSAERSGASPASDPTIAERLAELERLAEQLRQPMASQADLVAARDRSAAVLDELAEQAERAALDAAAAADAEAQRFSSLAQRDPPMSAAEFARALRDGRFGDAAEVLRAIERSAGRMPAAERQELAEYFRELASSAADSTSAQAEAPAAGTEPRAVTDTPDSPAADEQARSQQDAVDDAEAREPAHPQAPPQEDISAASSDGPPSAGGARDLSQALRDFADRIEQAREEAPAPAGDESPASDAQRPPGGEGDRPQRDAASPEAPRPASGEQQSVAEADRSSEPRGREESSPPSSQARGAGADSAAGGAPREAPQPGTLRPEAPKDHVQQSSEDRTRREAEGAKTPDAGALPRRERAPGERREPDSDAPASRERRPDQPAPAQPAADQRTPGQTPSDQRAPAQAPSDQHAPSGRQASGQRASDQQRADQDERAPSASDGQTPRAPDAAPGSPSAGAPAPGTRGKSRPGAQQGSRSDQPRSDDAPGEGASPEARPGASSEAARDTRTEQRTADPAADPAARSSAWPDASPNDQRGISTPSDAPSTPAGAKPAAQTPVGQEGQGSPEPAQGADPTLSNGGDGRSATPPSADPGDVPPGLERALRELEARREAAQRSEEQARRLREQAERLAQKMTPEERERLERWARALAREQGDGDAAADGARRDSPKSEGGTGRAGDGSEPPLGGAPPLADASPSSTSAGRPQDAAANASARGDREGAARTAAGPRAGAEAGAGPGRGLTSGAAPGREVGADRPADLDLLDRQHPELGALLAEWLSDEPTPEAGGASSTSPAQERVAAARRAAERAIEHSAVPPRYHELLRRYFGRLDGTVQKAAGATPPAQHQSPSQPQNPSQNPSHNQLESGSQSGPQPRPAPAPSSDAAGRPPQAPGAGTPAAP